MLFVFSNGFCCVVCYGLRLKNHRFSHTTPRFLCARKMREKFFFWNDHKYKFQLNLFLFRSCWSTKFILTVWTIDETIFRPEKFPMKAWSTQTTDVDMTRTLIGVLKKEKGQRACLPFLFWDVYIANLSCFSRIKSSEVRDKWLEYEITFFFNTLCPESFWLRTSKSCRL